MTIQRRFQGALLFALWTCTALVSGKSVPESSSDQLDRIVMSTGDVNRQSLSNYQHAIVKLALEHSEADFGAYSFDIYDAEIIGARVLREMEAPPGKGKINVHIATSSLLKQARFNTIHIPVRMGLLAYRVLVVSKKNLAKFSNIRTMEELRKYKAGSGARWTTTSVLKQHGFEVVLFPRYEPMYPMLKRGRFDFILRGVSEIYQEWEDCGEDCDDLVIVPGVQVYLPVPYYVFVSKHHPRIAERIEKGLVSAINDGSFKALFMSYHGGSLKRAKVAARHIISIPNYDLSNDPALKEPAFWLTPCDMRVNDDASSCVDFDDVMPGS